MTVGWKLDADDRAALLARFPPRYVETVADHVTLRFGTEEVTPLPTATAGEIVGEADDDAGVQALVVRIDGRAYGGVAEGRPQPRKKAARAEGSEDAAPARKAKRVAKPPPKPKPRPDRSALARAEAERTDADARHESERAALAKRQAELDRERRKLEADQASERGKLDRKVEAAREKYDRAMQAWRAD